MSEPNEETNGEKDRDRRGAPRTLNAKLLFGCEKEILIEHGGVRYRLRITRRGRLILTK